MSTRTPPLCFTFPKTSRSLVSVAMTKRVALTDITHLFKKSKIEQTEREIEAFKNKWHGVCLDHISVAELLPVTIDPHCDLNRVKKCMYYFQAIELSRIYTMFGENDVQTATNLPDHLKLGGDLFILLMPQLPGFSRFHRLTEIFQVVQDHYNAKYRIYRVNVVGGCGEIVYQGNQEPYHLKDLVVYLSDTEFRVFGVRNPNRLIRNFGICTC